MLRVKLRDIWISITPKGRIFGIALLSLGIILILIAAIRGQEAALIGDSDDPALEQLFDDLTSQRDILTMLGVSSIFLGLFGMVMLGERSISIVPAEAEMISQARISRQMLRGLNLSGNAVFVPRNATLDTERVFIPSGGNDLRLPEAISEDLVFSPGKDGSAPGALLIPPGADLLRICERESERSFDGIGAEALEGELQILKHGFGILRDFHIKERDGKLVMRIEHSGLGDACALIRAELPDTCRQLSCPACSCVLSGIAKALGRPIAVEEVKNTEPQVVFHLAPL